MHCIVEDLLKHCKLFASGVRVGGLYKLDVTNKSHQILTSTTMSIESIWHISYGHRNYHDLLLLQKQRVVERLPMLKNKYVACEGCELGKIYIDKLPSNLDRRRRNVLKLVHIDACGQMQTISLEGAYYFLLFIDDCTR